MERARLSVEDPKGWRYSRADVLRALISQHRLRHDLANQLLKEPELLYWSKDDDLELEW